MSLPESAFEQLLSTHHPTATEEAKRACALVEPLEQPPATNKEMACLQSPLEQVTSQCDEPPVDSHHAFLSPMQQLSYDLMSEIFICCLPEDHYPVPSLKEAPLLLTILCKDWREISLSTPRLWNAIHLQIPRTSSPPWKRDSDKKYSILLELQRDGVDGWLRRAGGLPLSLSIYQSSYCGVFNWEVDGATSSQLILELISKYSDKWCSLRLELRDPSLHSLVDFLQNKTLHLLESLTIHREKNQVEIGPYAAYATEVLRSCNRILNKAPNVHAFHLFHFAGHPVHYSVRWNQLTELSLVYGSGRLGGPQLNSIIEAITVLSLIANSSPSGSPLRSCALSLPYDCQGFRFVGDRRPAFVFPSLISLSVNFFCGPGFREGILEMQVAEIFSLIQAPSLSELTVTDENYRSSHTYRHEDPLWMEMPFVTFIQHSSCKLNSLTVCLPVTYGALVDCLRLTTELRSLCVDGISPLEPIFTETVEGSVPLNLISAPFIEALTPSDSEDDGVLCPKLESLKLRNCLPFLETQLIALARARWSMGKPSVAGCCVGRLKRLLVTFMRPSEVDITKTLHDLQDEGMQIQVKELPAAPRRGGSSKFLDSPWVE